jgi:hypothetical protein
MQSRTTIVWFVLAVLISSTMAHAADQPLMERLGKIVDSHAAGFSVDGKATIVHLSKKGSHDFTHEAQQGQCYRFFAVGEKDSFKLSIGVKKGTVLVGETADAYSAAVVDVCSSLDEQLSVTVSTPSFGGDLVYAVYKVEAKKAPAKSEVGSRMKVLAVKNVPGAKLIAVPTTAMLGKGKSFSLTVSVEEQACYKFIAVGGSGVDDISLQVKSKAQVVTQDDSTGDHPVVEYCPSKSGKVVVSFTAAQGQGMVLASAFEAPASTILVGVTDVQTALDKRLEAEAEIYAPDMNMVGVIKKGDIVNKKPLWFDVLLSKGVCYKFIAVGGAGINDLDVALLKNKSQGDKNAMAADTTDDDAPIASYCSENSGAGVVKLSSKGSGIYSMGVYAGASAEAGATAGYEELTTVFESQAKLLDEKWTAADTMKTAVIGEGTEASIDVKMSSENCYGLLVVGLGDIKAMKVTVTAEGNKLAQSAKTQSTMFVEVCPDNDLVAAVKVTSQSGFGPMALKAYSVESGFDQIFVPVGGLGKSFIATNIRKLHGKKGKKRPAITELLEGDLQTAKTKTFDVELKGGKCYTVIAAGNPSVKELQVKLYSPLGEEIAAGKDQGADVVFETTPCPTWNGTYKLEVKMFMGYGKFGAQVFGQ